METRDYGSSLYVKPSPQQIGYQNIFINAIGYIFAIATFARVEKNMFQFCGVAMAINGNAKMVRREHHTSAIHNIYVFTQISAHECIKSHIMGTRKYIF